MTRERRARAGIFLAREDLSLRAARRADDEAAQDRRSGGKASCGSRDAVSLVGLSGGIACYKACEVVRLLRAGGRARAGRDDAGAREFVTPLTLQTLSGKPVATETFDLTQESEIGHIRLADTADVVLIAPATANVHREDGARASPTICSRPCCSRRARRSSSRRR